MPKELDPAEIHSVHEAAKIRNDKTALAYTAKRYSITQKRTLEICNDHLASYAAANSPEMAMIDPFNIFGNNQPTPYNPSELVSTKGLRVYDMMRRDDQVKAALQFKKLAVMSAGWTVTSPDGEDDEWEPTKFILEQFTGLPGSFDSTLLEMLSGVDFGFSVSEIVLEKGPQAKLRALKTKRPHFFHFRTDEFGNLADDGLEQETATGRVKLPVSKFVIYSHQREFSNYYGRSDLDAAYRAWWAKENSYRWLQLLLQRYGVPPVFALFNKDTYNTTQQNQLYNVINNMQGATAGVMPRGKKEDLEFWSPELAGQGSAVFEPALNMFNADIARAILVPGMLGLTPDMKVGAFAKSKVNFDSFMLVVAHLQRDFADQAINDQLIRPLVDINFGPMDAYPTFKFIDPEDDTRGELLKIWQTLVAGGSVKPTPDDEAHIRSMLKMPDRDMSGDDEEDRGGDDASEDDDDGEDAPMVTENAEVSFSRQRNGYEAKVDFTQVTDDFESLDAGSREAISAAVINMRTKTLAFIRKQFKGDAAFVTQLKNIRGTPALAKEVKTMLRHSFDAGRNTVKAELNAAKEMSNAKRGLKFDERIVLYADDPNFVPADALKRLRAREFWITGIIEDDILADARNVLLMAVENGEPMSVTMDKLDDVFKPFILPEALGTAFRLETIVRTNVTDAYNRGRVVEARRAGEFLKGFEYSAIMDGRTTEVCTFLDGKVFRADDPGMDALIPPRHFNCRSILVPVTLGEPVDAFTTKAEESRGAELSGKGFK